MKTPRVYSENTRSKIKTLKMNLFYFLAVSYYIGFIYLFFAIGDLCRFLKKNWMKLRRSKEKQTKCLFESKKRTLKSSACQGIDSSSLGHISRSLSLWTKRVVLGDEKVECWDSCRSWQDYIGACTMWSKISMEIVGLCFSTCQC